MARKKQNNKQQRAASAAQRAVVPAMIGSGDYWTDFRSGLSKALSAASSAVPKGTFQKVGAGIGGAFGQSALGGGAGKLVSQILGFGDYSIRANSLVQPLNMGSTIAQFGDMSNATHVCHREYIGDVIATGSSAFNSVTYSFNPGQVATFPWLSTIAGNYESYQFLGAVVQFKSTASDYATGTALGAVILASEYDTADASYATKIEMENSQYCTSTKPSMDCIHPIECDPSVNVTPRLYVREGAVPAGKDIRLYDHCNVQVATVGVPAAANTALGELWISYEIALFKPQINLPGAMDHFTGVAVLPYYTGVNVPLQSGSTIGGRVGPETYYFPPNTQNGTFLFVYTVVGNLTTITTQMASILTNCVGVNYLVNGGGSVIVAPENGTAAQRDILYMRTVTVTGLNASIALLNGTLPSVGVFDLWVVRLPYSLRS